MPSHRLGVDIGGTFTDLVLLDEHTGRLSMVKVPTTPRDPAVAVRDGVQRILSAANLDPGEVRLLIHGTTLALNTVIERSGADVGLIVTRGYRDLLELRRLRLRDAQNFFADRPEPLVPRRRVREVDERMLADGSVYLAMNAAEVAEAARRLVGDGCTAIAICFLHAYVNPAHEEVARQMVEEACPGVYVCTSHEVWPQRREYERCLVTVINAFVGGRMKAYLTDLERQLRDLRLTAPLLSTKSNGGMMTARSAGDRPVETLFSGPASGVIGASYLARQAGEDRVITLDMGGTSADVSVLAGGYTFSTDASVAGMPVVLPTIDISSIGAGGGSIAWTDAMGVLKVGPRSAGAVPGPACYGEGGSEPTVTDAYVTLGIIDPERFLGGSMRLRRDLAVAVMERLGRILGRGPEPAAWSVLEVATANMFAQFAPLMARHGIDPREYAILAYGGAGPTHAFLLAREVQVRKVIVPPLPGGLCALGCLVADLRADFTRTWSKPLDPAGAADLDDAFRVLETQARGWVERESLPVAAVRCECTAEMRYTGQSFEVPVRLDRIDPPDILQRFHDRYQAVYGYVDAHAPVEIVDIRVQVIGEMSKPHLEPPVPADGDARTGQRTVFFEGRSVPVPVYDRRRMGVGNALRGPVIVEQYDSTTFVPPGFRLGVDARGNLIGEAE